MVFPVVMCGCESWTIKKAEHQRIGAFEHTDYICYSFSSKEQTSFNFMTAVTVQSDFGGQKIKSATVSTFSLPINHEVMGQHAMILIF